jgi:hypothetical protein
VARPVWLSGRQASHEHGVSPADGRPVRAMYLRCVTGDRPRSWVDWLSWAEYCYNTSFHTALRATPFEVVYGRPPPSILPYTMERPRRRRPTHSSVVATRCWRRCASGFYRRNSSPRSTTTPTIVTWSSKPAPGSGCASSTRPQSLDPQARRKLGPRYAGSFQVLEHVGKVLPPSASSRRPDS